MFSNGIERKGTLLCLLRLALLDRERLRKPLQFVLVLGGDFLLHVSLMKVVVCNTPRLRGQEVDGASAQTERYRGSWTPAKSLQIPPDVNTTQSIE